MMQHLLRISGGVSNRSANTVPEKPSRSSWHRAITACLAAVVLVLTGCQSSPPQSSAPTSAPVSTSAFPSTEAGKAMEWIHTVLEQDADVAEEDVEGRFSQEFTAEVSNAEIVSLFNENLRPAAPFDVSDYAGDELTSSATFTGSEGDPFVVQIAVDADGTINGLLFTPENDHEEATTLEDAEARLDELPIDVNYLVTSGDRNIAASGEQDVAPIGSAFKLWVLLAVVNSIDDGSLNWNDELTVEASNKSLPSGDLQNLPDGSTVTVREAAQKMIEISDNTATDLLITAVGREKVDELVPEHMRPVATTRQFFELVWGEGTDRLGEYSEADEQGRAKLLDSLEDLTVSATDVDMDTSKVSAPTWAASPEEVADIWEQLDNASEQHPELDEILGANTAVSVSGYNNLWFKGGSLPGVLAGSWTGQTESGDRVTVVLIASSDDATAVNDTTMA
ncbi:MAG: serine hydrolase [Ancrocorticia populi]|uniref:serine hydrolase n=1 Tax=Ancrocorticia populi TaxID=2175228 RepID=UPI003F8E55DA